HAEGRVAVGLVEVATLQEGNAERPEISWRRHDSGREDSRRRRFGILAVLENRLEQRASERRRAGPGRRLHARYQRDALVTSAAELAPSPSAVPALTRIHGDAPHMIDVKTWIDLVGSPQAAKKQPRRHERDDRQRDLDDDERAAERRAAAAHAGAL